MKATAWLIDRKYNYSIKFEKALMDGNTKYIKSLIKRGKAIPIEAEAHKDSCGTFSYAIIKKTK